MAMEKPIALEDFRVGNGSVNSYGGEAVQLSLMLDDDDVKESENPENGILEDLDSYWEDINNRLTISRMVSDSVIKGMVSAVEQEAAEKIAQKELELARLKETLNLYHVGADGSESSGSLVMQREQGSAKHGRHSSFSDGLFDCDRIEGSLGSIKNVAKEQLKNLRKEIDRMRGSCSIRRIGSGSEMVGLSGILQDKVSDIKWMDVDKTLDSLRTTLDSICKQVDDMVYLSKTSLFQWQQEKEFQGEIEDMVIMNCIRSLKEEFEERLWDQNAQFYDSEKLSRLEKIREISSLRQELDAISKSLAVQDIGHISSHGSMEIGEDCNNNKGSDHFHRKVSGNHVSLSASLWEGNGKHDEPIIPMPENLEYAQLKHMSKEELVSYFKTEMTKMKRNHEQRVQEMTEEYFSLKREFLRERGSSLPLKKDKDFDILRKKIPEVILKLDDILLENEKLPAFSKNAESLCSLKDRLESLLAENRQLRGMITDKKREVKRLTSDTTEIMLQHSLCEANLVKGIGNLQCALEDARIEASISEDVYKCLLREAVDSSKSVSEQSDMESRIMLEVYETIFKEAAYNAGASSMCEFEDSDMVFIIMQGLCGLIFRESLKEAEETINDLNLRYMNEKKLRVNLETEALQKEDAWNLEVAEKESLKQQMLLLSSLIKEKEKLSAAELVKEKERFELVSVELNNLRDKRRQQEILISESSEESNAIRGELKIAQEQIDIQKMEMNNLKQRLQMTMLELKESDEERKRLLSVAQERQNAMALAEAKEREHKRQIQTVIIVAQCLFQTVADFEDRVMEDINRSNIRLGNLSSQYRALIQKAKVNNATELMYKQRLERKCSDLQKAENEVDLLGDEVDALLSLLEKIYIALDHYSPILQHYPGVMEILKLVRRELSGESMKPA